MLVALSVVISQWTDAEGGPREAVQRFGIWAPLVALAVQTVTKMTPVGNVFMAVVNGALFPLWLAISLNLLSGLVGGMIMYVVWRRGDEELDLQNQMQKLPGWVRRRAGDNLFFLTVLRFLPWVGGNMADLVAGAHRIPVRTQVLSIILGYLPGSVIYALMGAGMIHLS
jgi:uncharacterized membrane protein YdjX (TVP38/TMEM64 family)